MSLSQFILNLLSRKCCFQRDESEISIFAAGGSLKWQSMAHTGYPEVMTGQFANLAAAVTCVCFI